MTQLYCDTTYYRGRICECAWGIGTQFFISDMTGLCCDTTCCRGRICKWTWGTDIQFFISDITGVYWDMTQLYCDTTCYRGRIWKWTWGTDWPACLPSCMAMLSAACESCHISMSHVSHMNESCLTYECAVSCMSAILQGDVERCVWVMSYVHESCLTCERAMLHVDEFSLIHEWVMSHIWIRHVMHVYHCAWRC